MNMLKTVIKNKNYLYDDSQREIFSTSVNDNDDYNMSARLKLNGEMFVYSDYYTTGNGYRLTDKTIPTPELICYTKKNTNTDSKKGMEFLLLLDDVFTYGGVLNVDNGHEYTFSVLKRYTYNVSETTFPTSPNQEIISQEFKNNHFTGQTLKIKTSNNSLLELTGDEAKTYWYCEFTVTIKTNGSGTIIFNPNNANEGIYMGDLFEEDNGIVFFKKKPLEDLEFISNVQVESTVLNRANRYFLTQKYDTSVSEQDEYGGGFYIYNFEAVADEPIDVSMYNTQNYQYLDNNFFKTKNIYIANGKYYQTSSETSVIKSKTKTAIFINKTQPDIEGDTTKRRIFTIAMKESDGKIKNMLCAFNNGEVIKGGYIQHNEVDYTQDLEKLPVDITIRNGQPL